VEPTKVVKKDTPENEKKPPQDVEDEIVEDDFDIFEDEESDHAPPKKPVYVPKKKDDITEPDQEEESLEIALDDDDRAFFGAETENDKDEPNGDEESEGEGEDKEPVIDLDTLRPMDEMFETPEEDNEEETEQVDSGEIHPLTRPNKVLKFIKLKNKVRAEIDDMTRRMNVVYSELLTSLEKDVKECDRKVSSVTLMWKNTFNDCKEKLKSKLFSATKGKKVPEFKTTSVDEMLDGIELQNVVDGDISDEDIKAHNAYKNPKVEEEETDVSEQLVAFIKAEKILPETRSDDVICPQCASEFKNRMREKGWGINGTLEQRTALKEYTTHVGCWCTRAPVKPAGHNGPMAAGGYGIAMTSSIIGPLMYLIAPQFALLWASASFIWTVAFGTITFIKWDHGYAVQIISYQLTTFSKWVRALTLWRKMHDFRDWFCEKIGLSFLSARWRSTFIGMICSIPIAAVAVVIPFTINYVRSRKQIFREKGFTHAFPDYCAKVAITLGAFASVSIVITQSSALINAIKNLTNTGKSFFKAARADSVKSANIQNKSVNITSMLNEINRSQNKPIIERVVLYSQPAYLSVFYGPTNTTGVNSLKVANQGTTERPIQYIGSRYKEALIRNYPSLTFISTTHGMVPDFKTPTGQSLLSDILGERDAPLPDDVITQYARVMTKNMWQLNSRGKYTQKLKYFIGKTEHNEVVSDRCWVSNRAAAHLRNLLEIEPDTKVSLFTFKTTEEDISVFAFNESEARDVYAKSDIDVDISTFLASFSKMFRDHWKQFAGIGLLIVATYLTVVWVFNYFWAEADKQREGRDRRTKGDRIASADLKRVLDNDKNLTSKRDSLRQEITDIQKSIAADMADGDFSYMNQYQTDLKDLMGKLKSTEELIQAVYDGQFDSIASTKKSSKKTNTDKSVPNSQKARKIKEDGICQVAGCGTPTEFALCNKHHRKFTEGQDFPHVSKKGQCSTCLPESYLQKFTKTEAKTTPTVSSSPVPEKKTFPVVKPVKAPRVWALKEAVVSDKGNNDSILRQSVTKRIYAIIRIYAKTSTGYIKNGVAFKARMEKDSPIRLYCAHHVTEDGAYIKNDNKFIKINFTKIGGDLSVSDDNVPVQGKALTICKNGASTNEATLHTLSMSEDEYSIAKCSGDYNEDDNIFSHSSDTFSGQCGSPYINDNGLVYYIHVSTDNRSNRGLSPHAIKADF
jgi:hypothetical protein